MTSSFNLASARAILLLVLACGLVSAHAWNANEVLHSFSASSTSSCGDGVMSSSPSTQSSSDQPHDTRPGDSIDESSSVASSSSISSSGDYSDSEGLPDSEVDSEDALYVPVIDLNSSYSSASSSSNGDDVMSSSPSTQSSSDQPHDTRPDDSIDESSSVASSSSISSSGDYSDVMMTSSPMQSSSDEPHETMESEDPLYVPVDLDSSFSSSYSSASSSESLWMSESSGHQADTAITPQPLSRRTPAVIQLQPRPDRIAPSPVRRGRPPAVFRPWLGGEEADDGGHPNSAAAVEESSGDIPAEPDRQPWGKDSAKTEQGHSMKGDPSKGRQWGGEPSPHHNKVLRQADVTYLDLYLCGQFLPGDRDRDAKADDFAVAAFNYAGRAQPFSPCSPLGSTDETDNFVYHRAKSSDSSTFRRVVAGLQSAWLRYGARNGVTPRVVHLFTFTMPSTVDQVQELLSVRSSIAFHKARFVVGYVRQETSPEDPGLSTRSAEDFLAVVDALRGGGIEVVRVCGRCARVAGMTGRRRAAMRYGMAAVETEVGPASQCRPVQEHDIPGAELASSQRTCHDSFQGSVRVYALRTLQRRCPTVQRRSDPDEELLQGLLNALTRTCVWDPDCWSREGTSLRPLIVPEAETRCSLSQDISFGRMIVRCVSVSVGRPFDV